MRLDHLLSKEYPDAFRQTTPTHTRITQNRLSVFAWLSDFFTGFVFEVEAISNDTGTKASDLII